jgi:hypothetical protein
MARSPQLTKGAAPRSTVGTRQPDASGPGAGSPIIAPSEVGNFGEVVDFFIALYVLLRLMLVCRIVPGRA